MNKTKRPKKGEKNSRPGVEPWTSCMGSLLLLYCATPHHTNMSSHLVIPTVFIQFESAKLLNFYRVLSSWFLAFRMQRLFENHIFFISLTKMIKNYDKTFLNIR